MASQAAKRSPLKVLHTSDWHLGRLLYGKKRYEEFEAFLSWLAATIEQHQVDVLIVAGDVFDNGAPSNRAQELYYRFLCQISQSTCRHVIVTAGNHDSPSFLNAPKELLRFLNIHVIGSSTEDPADEVLVLKNQAGREELIVCAVPYLRDRDLRVAEAGESIEDKERKLLAGIARHYGEVFAVAETRRQALGTSIPVVATGHLFAAGGETVEGDGVRELYIGSLAHVSAALFPATLDYVALGHLHVPQKVGGAEHVRYSGSPIPMGFGEAKQVKTVNLVSFTTESTLVEPLKVPNFQHLEYIAGTEEQICCRLRELSGGGPIWLEILYEGTEIAGNLRGRLEEAIAGTGMEILRIRNNRVVERALMHLYEDESLDDLSVSDVFVRCLDSHGVPEEQRPALLDTYQEIVTILAEHDVKAE